MKIALLPPLMLAFLFASSETLAHHKSGHHIPPGLLKKLNIAPADKGFVGRAEQVCLVSTDHPLDPHGEIVETRWLPRGLAEELMKADGGFIIIHPDLQDRDGCEAFALDD